MASRSGVYKSLLHPVRSVSEPAYRRTLARLLDGKLHPEFVDHFFESSDEYARYVNEFDEGPAADLRNEALERYRQLTGKDGLSGIGLDTSRSYYAIVRKLRPETVVETGVCNGVSTLSILLALHENGSGTLHSIDYPYRADESLAEFRAETFEEYGGAAIPSDREPGWIIPRELRTRWDLTIGKSQRILPGLVTDLGSLDVFIHDSEHSSPCMMFEYELAYEWLADSGVILSDDITWNSAFTEFTEIRRPTFGNVSWNVGYIQRRS